MQWQFSAGVITEAGTALVILIVAVFFPWRDTSRRARLIGPMLLVIAALWILTHSLEISLPSASYKAYLMGVQLIWSLLSVTLWSMYIIHYTATFKWQTGWINIMFGIMPLLAIMGVATNHISGLMWTDTGISVQNPYLPLKPTYGLLYWACLLYAGALIGSGSFLVLKKVVRQPNFRRWEPWVLILAVVIPLLAALFEIADLRLKKDLMVGITPFFSSIASIALVLSLPRFYLQKVIAVARDTVFEHIGDCVIVLNMQNRIVDINPAAERLAGYTSSEALGFPVEQIWPNWPVPMVISDAPALLEEITLEHAGEQRTYDLHSYTIFDQQNHPLNKVVLLIDITGRKQSEEKLELAYQKEKQQREELQEEAKARGMFIEIIGHELRTPLTPLVACSEVLRDILISRKNEMEQKLVTNICSSVNSLAQRLEELLDLAKLSRGTFILHQQQVNIIDLVNKTVTQFKPIAEEQSNQLILEIQGNLPEIQADPSRLQQVLDNLVSNALKYSPQNTTVTLIARRTGSNLIIEVQDEGVGVSPEEQQQLLNPYHRVQQDTQKYPGIGLKLAISKHIVEAHGGKVWVESQLGRGSAFFVQLPCKPE